MTYRREIDGLRAVAVLPVILFHAGFKTFEGGFVGVDVFFVISGYLITTIILSDMNEGKFSIVTFYERRARRILPALFFVMFCCLPFAWVWLAPSHLEAFCQSLAAVSLFSSNVLFWKESGYFATAAELKPLLHTWSLAVEEQYYVLFPLFLMALWRLRKRWIFGSLMFIAVASLAGAQYGAYHYPAATFFLLPSRIWELAIGALIAFYFLYKKEQEGFIRSHKIISEVFGYLGLGLILYSIFAFDKATPFPGFFALIPTIGTALIIIFTSQETTVGRFLGRKIMVGIGLISYSTYLWHQPLFVFARHKSATELSVELLLFLSAFSIVLAYISWRFVEVPFRTKGGYSRGKIFAFAVVGSVFFAAVGLAGHLNDGFPDRFGLPEGLISSFERPAFRCLDKDKMVAFDDFSCGLGDENIKPSFFVFGDSHAGSLHDAFNSAALNIGVSGRFAYASGCPPLLGVNILRGDLDNNGCKELNKKVRGSIIDNNIKSLFLVARWNSFTNIYKRAYPYLALTWQERPSVATSRKAFAYGFKRTMDEYERLGVSVFIIIQVPSQKNDPEYVYKHAYEKNYSNSDRLKTINNHSIDYSKHIELNRYVNNVISSNNYPTIVNFDNVFCDNKLCSIGTLDVSYYNDKDHLSLSGAKKLIPSIQAMLNNSL